MNSHIPSDKLSIFNLCILSLMAALMFSTKVALSSLPNINLNALLIILTTVFFGWQALYTVGVYIMLEGIFYGFSIWWVSYLLVWPALVLAAMGLRKNQSPVIWAVMAGVYVLLFGPLMYVVLFVVSGNWSGFLPMWIAGIPYDIIHAVSNFLTVLFLYSPLSKVISNYIVRL